MNRKRQILMRPLNEQDETNSDEAYDKHYAFTSQIILSSSLIITKYTVHNHWTHGRLKASLSVTRASTTVDL